MYNNTTQITSVVHRPNTTEYNLQCFKVTRPFQKRRIGPISAVTSQP